MKTGMEVVADSANGVLHELTGVIARFGGNVSSVEITQDAPRSHIVFEIELPGDPEELAGALRTLGVVHEVRRVDTIPLVGEEALAAAVRAAARLPRVKAIVLAGSLMGGDIEKAVREVRARGLLVISLNMAGSAPDAADLVVTDPVQAGVMTVMIVAETAKFSLERLKRRVF